VANGNVRIKDGELEIWCRHANYALNGEDGTLDEATIASGQFVATGSVVRKVNKNEFEIDEGTYSNCNLDLIKDSSVGGCQFDWKISGRSIKFTEGEYIRIYDALLYMKKIPVMYTPFFIAPMKSKRQSGLLMPHYSYVRDLGGGLQLPYFAALGPWHDLTIDPTYWSEKGYHVGLNYRYIYSPAKQGTANFYFTQWRFDRNQVDVANRPDDPTRSRFLGLIGEWAFTANNVYSLGGRTGMRADIRLLSDPYYPYYFSGDLDSQSQLTAVRSQISLTSPGDELLFAARIQRLQSLLIPSVQIGIDRGPVSELPTLFFSKATAPLLGSFLSYELDSRLTHFFRPDGNDPALGSGGYRPGDFIRTGTRLQIEPRLIANVPMPPGFVFQPVLTAGTQVYQFNLPNATVAHQQYLQADFPLSLYLSRTFETGIPGLEKINHVFQPRVVLSNSLYLSDTPNHPFFQLAPNPGPRFDINDFLLPYRYVRLELINRFRRRTERGVERFFRLQVSEQYNIRSAQNDPRFDVDPRYKHLHGPIELLSELGIGPISFQAQASYQVDTVGGPPDPVHEYDWSSTLSYAKGIDGFSLTTLFRKRLNNDETDQIASLTAYKVLPTFFDISGSLEYSMRRGQLRGYTVGLYFAPKPRACWSLSLITGRDSALRPFANLGFTLRFGDVATGRGI
jgi:hypothetical protein